MTLRKAIMWSLDQYPEFYLVDPEVLFVEATNKAAEVFSMSELLAEMNRLEGEKLVQSQREFRVLKWMLTGSGRAWVKGYKGA